MIKSTTTALVCLGVTFGATAAFANDKDSAGLIAASEITNIEFASAESLAKSSYRFDFRDRRDEVRGIINDRIDMVRERRDDIKFILREDETLSREAKRELWREFAELRTRLERLYTDRVAANRFGIMDLEELEEFYSQTVSVS